MKKYCTSCGKQIVFSVTNKPKFCDSCGTKLNLGESLGSDNEEAEQEEESLGVDVEESTGGFSSNISIKGINFFITFYIINIIFYPYTCR